MSRQSPLGGYDDHGIEKSKEKSKARSSAIPLQQGSFFFYLSSSRATYGSDCPSKSTGGFWTEPAFHISSPDRPPTLYTPFFSTPQIRNSPCVALSASLKTFCIPAQPSSGRENSQWRVLPLSINAGLMASHAPPKKVSDTNFPSSV